MTEACTCHISNLRCKNEKCLILISSRGLFKEELANILRAIMVNLFKEGFSKEESIRALRREAKHLNKLQQDVFDETANSVWRKNEFN